MSAPEWLKIVGPLVVAVLTAFGVATSQTSGTVQDDRFREVAVSNCEADNDLRSALREVLLRAPVDRRNPERGQQFIDEAIELLNPRDCQALVAP